MKRFTLYIPFLTLFICIPLFLGAEEKEITLEPVIVTATRDEQEVRKIPANVTVITREEIERSRAQTTVDLLRNEAGVVVSDLRGTGKNVFVDIRGFGETGPLNILVLVDGRRVNEIDLSGVDWSQIPLDQIERIEILRGPGSVLYGDNAAGGVINIITKKPEKAFSAEAGLALGSYHLNKETGSVSGRWGPLSAILHGGYHGTEGYRDNGFLRAKDIGGKFIYDVSETLSFNLSGGFHRDDSGLPGSLTREQIHTLGRRATRTPDDKFETEDGYLALGMNTKLSEDHRIESELSYRDREVSTFLFDALSQPSFRDNRDLTTWGLTPRYILERPLWDHANKLTLGVDFYSSDSVIFSDSAFSVPQQNKSEVTKQSTGLYALDEFSILERLIFSLGYRREWVTFDLSQETPRFEDKVRDNEAAWNLGLNYSYRKRSSAFLSVKRSFRFPVSDELIEFIFDPVNFFQVTEVRVNPAIKTQTGYHYEAGIRHAFSERVEGNVTLFRIDTKDEIFFNPVTFSNENYPRTRREGVELGATVRPLQRLSLWGNYSRIRPLLRKGPFSGSDIPLVPRDKASAGADLDVGKGFLFRTSANYVGSRYLISDFENRVDKLDEYYTVDARLSYAYKGLNAFVGVNNLFDRKYAEFGSFVGGTQFFFPSPERNYAAGVSYKF
jgi:iron complex outermembrane receptor protein